MAKRKPKDTEALSDLAIRAGQNIRYHFMDSGAFSLRFLADKWSKLRGLPSEGYYDSPEHFEYLDAYAAFVKKYRIAIDLYANVDVMGDSKRSFRNQMYLESLGIRPVPVVHFQDGLDILEQYLDRGYKYIGLGGLARKALNPECQNWLDRIFDRICDTPDRTPSVKVHGFGVTGFRWLFRYPWYSIDSTSWRFHASYGSVIVPKTSRSREEPARWEFKHRGWYYTFRYDITPEIVDVTEATLKSMTGNHYKHMEKLNWLRPLRITKWLEHIRMPHGITKHAENVKDNEIIEEGISNSFEIRSLANARYYVEFMKTMPEYPQPFNVRPRRSLGLL